MSHFVFNECCGFIWQDNSNISSTMLGNDITEEGEEDAEEQFIDADHPILAKYITVTEGVVVQRQQGLHDVLFGLWL